MFELLLGAMVLAACFKVGVRATVDAVTTTRAAKAGQWDLIDRDWQRRAEQVPWAERWARAWAERRAARHRQAGGDGAFRPGAREYARDLYHGWWEDRLDRRAKKRAGRPEWQYDPDRAPWHRRFDDAVTAKVDALRQRWGQRVEPKPAAETAPVPVPNPADLPPGTWTPGPDGERVELKPTDAERPDPQPADEPPAADETTTPKTEPEENDMDETEQAAAATEVNNNEDARRVFLEQIDAANQAAEALSVYEAAQRRLAAAGAGLEGINAKRFDVQAQAAEANAADLLPSSDMSEAAGAIEGIRASAESGLAALDKYRDAEDVVNSNNVDATTLETAGSS